MIFVISPRIKDPDRVFGSSAVVSLFVRLFVVTFCGYLVDNLLSVMASVSIKLQVNKIQLKIKLHE